MNCTVHSWHIQNNQYFWQLIRREDSRKLNPKISEINNYCLKYQLCNENPLLTQVPREGNNNDLHGHLLRYVLFTVHALPRYFNGHLLHYVLFTVHALPRYFNGHLLRYVLFTVHALPRYFNGHLLRYVLFTVHALPRYFNGHLLRYVLFTVHALPRYFTCYAMYSSSTFA